VRPVTLEDVDSGLAFVGRERRDVDQRGDLRVACRRDDGTGIRVADKDGRTVDGETARATRRRMP
jgi:hypothetical protein